MSYLYDERVLFVDDDSSLLKACQRSMGERIHLDTAPSAEEALEALATRGPYAVVLSDHYMPNMGGIDFLAQVRKTSPDTIRMLITGQAEVDMAVRAVNEGAVFQFLTKPCPPETLIGCLERGIAQYRLVVAEKELLHLTLRGSIRALTEMTGAASPEALARASRACHLMSPLAVALEARSVWVLDLAAMLSQVGCVAVPHEVLHKAYRGEPLSEEEERIFRSHPETARDIIGKLPRLADVADAVAHQLRGFNGAGPPDKGKTGRNIPLGGRMLKIILDYDSLTLCGKGASEATDTMRQRRGVYDPEILMAFAEMLSDTPERKSRPIRLDGLEAGMVLAADVLTVSGVRILERGQEITETVRLGLRRMSATGVSLKQPFEVFI